MGLRYESGRLLVLDQTRLPHEEVWLESRAPEDMIEMIQSLRIRGAPLIGVGAALALAHFSITGVTKAQFIDAARNLRAARPTAVNLMAAVDRILAAMGPGPLETETIVRCAEDFFDEDVRLCEGMAAQGAPLIQNGDNILTHCNTGGLATVGIGTALGVIRRAHESGKRLHVFVDETRPLLQGARLTAWELGKLRVPYTLICDNMAAMLMKKGKINRIFVGSDRIAANGDVANKIGTYSVAVNAAFHGVPFYAVAPATTVDSNCPTGEQIPIEERPPAEVRNQWSPRECNVFNPAFDVTPIQIVSGVVLDDRIIQGGRWKK